MEIIWRSTLKLKIAYIGGGSCGWERKLMFDLALCPGLAGRVALYDIDLESARLNERFRRWKVARFGQPTCRRNERAL